MDYLDAGTFFAFYAVMLVVIIIFALAGYILTSFFLMKIFEKAGVQGKWRAWVPVYNAMIFVKLGDVSPWLVLYGLGASLLLSWIPLIGQLVPLAILAVMAIAAWRVGLKLQKEAVWVVLYVLLAIVWLGINAFDKSRWNPAIAPAPWAGNAFLADKTVWEGVPVQPSATATAAPQGYAAPAPQGYAPPAPQGYAPSAGNPVPPAPAAPVNPPAPVAPSAPPAPPAPPVPPAPPAPPVDPNAQI